MTTLLEIQQRVSLPVRAILHDQATSAEHVLSPAPDRLGLLDCLGHARAKGVEPVSAFGAATAVYPDSVEIFKHLCRTELRQVALEIVRTTWLEWLARQLRDHVATRPSEPEPDKAHINGIFSACAVQSEPQAPEETFKLWDQKILSGLGINLGILQSVPWQDLVEKLEDRLFELSACDDTDANGDPRAVAGGLLDQILGALQDLAANVNIDASAFLINALGGNGNARAVLIEGGRRIGYRVNKRVEVSFMPYPEVVDARDHPPATHCLRFDSKGSRAFLDNQLLTDMPDYVNVLLYLAATQGWVSARDLALHALGMQIPQARHHTSLARALWRDMYETIRNLWLRGLLGTVNPPLGPELVDRCTEVGLSHRGVPSKDYQVGRWINILALRVPDPQLRTLLERVEALLPSLNAIQISLESTVPERTSSPPPRDCLEGSLKYTCSKIVHHINKKTLKLCAAGQCQGECRLIAFPQSSKEGGTDCDYRLDPRILVILQPGGLP